MRQVCNVVCDTIIIMLEPKDLQKLFQLLNRGQDTLQEIEGAFLSVFNESMAVFRASYSLSNLLHLNLLTAPQRITALFLLIENFKSEGIKKHPFGATILNVSQYTIEPFERKMIADLTIDSKRDKYARSKLTALYDEQQLTMEHVDERPEIKKLRDDFVSNLPKVAQWKRSQVLNVISDSAETKDIPEEEVSAGSIRKQDISHEGFHVGFLRPIPQFLPVTGSQFNWLSPGVVSDLHWDNTGEMDKKLSRPRALMRKATESTLTREECGQLERMLESEPYAVLNIDLKPQNLGSLLLLNPSVAANFFYKISNYPVVSQYLDSLLNFPTSVRSIEFITSIITEVNLPNEFLATYVLKIMKDAEKLPQDHKDKFKVGKFVAVFIETLIRNRVFNHHAFVQEIDFFTKSFIDQSEVQTLRKRITKQ